MNEIAKIRAEFALENLEIEAKHLMSLLAIWEDNFPERTMRNEAIMKRFSTNINTLKRIMKI